MGLDPVTVVITRHVRPGCEEAFEQAVREWVPVSTKFPGHRGSLLLRPHEHGQEYGALVRFDSLASWRELEMAPEYLAFLERIRPPLDEQPHVEIVTGMEAWFRTPGALGMPPRWKMAAVTWVGVCFGVWLFESLMEPGLIGWSWPWLPRFLLINAVIVAALTWLVMPVLTKVFRPWLFPGTGSTK